MNFKRIITFLLCFIMLFSFASCVSEGNGEGEATEATSALAEETSAPDVSETTEAPETTAAPTENNAKKSLKILAVGNSFSSDAMEYLYQIAKNAGFKEIILGNLYYGGCTLDQHYFFASKDSSEYTYYKNTTGTWRSTKNYKFSYAIVEEDWDYVVLQQSPHICGLETSYGRSLTKMIEYIKEGAPNATLIWHTTWAYQKDSTHSAFANYNNNQMKMYNMIIDCVKSKIVPNENFEAIIPCTTSIQNARTSFLGDTLTRDGYHLDYNIGRYIAGLTWYATITGESVENITYKPSGVSDDMMKVAKEAVMNAINNPFEITKSAFPTK